MTEGDKVTVVVARSRIILRVLVRIALRLLRNTVFRRRRFSHRVTRIVKAWGRIRVWLEFVFASEVHLLWNIAKLLVWLIHARVWHLGDELLAPPSGALPI